MEIPQQDLDSLKEAKQLLESPSFAARVAEAVGYPIEKGLSLLPKSMSGLLHWSTRRALNEALKLAVRTLGKEPRENAHEGLHRVAATASGAVGGLFGAAALPVELPLSTTIMLRSIAEIAASQGEDLRSLDARLACMEVFALGGRSASDNAAETGYYIARSLLARQTAEAARYIAQRGLAEQGAPPIVRLVATLASRFGVVVSEKMAAQLVPLIGAAGGGLLNLVFIEHFQAVARGHFTVRRLERSHGEEGVKRLYEQLP